MGGNGKDLTVFSEIVRPSAMSAIFLPQSKPASERNSPGRRQAFRYKKMTLQQTGGAGLRRGQ